METTHLFGEYSFRQVTLEEICEIISQYHDEFFENNIDFDVTDSLSESEKEAMKILSHNMGKPYRLNIAIFHGEQCIGWHYGWQENSEKFYMCNTAIFPEYRKQGVYSALLPHILSIIKKQGFQILYSRHHSTNNAVIIPKLRIGFVISGFEISDRFGTLVHLSYYFNPLRRKAMQFRTGDMRPDDELRLLLNL
ncbi:MAG: GNAT family N-acetyltransferase [Ignavibacteriae bacterium]|nr:GNAT family N-acetyltransferase [Ignavibacteriota bacterium]